MVMASDVSNMFFFFFQAEDGIRDLIVTGVQTCALPISLGRAEHAADRRAAAPARRVARDPPGARRAEDRMRHSVFPRRATAPPRRARAQIGRASCRERV